MEKFREIKTEIFRMKYMYTFLNLSKPYHGIEKRYFNLHFYYQFVILLKKFMFYTYMYDIYIISKKYETWKKKQ